MYFPSNFKQSWLQICSFVFSVSNFQETQIPSLNSVSNTSILGIEIVQFSIKVEKEIKSKSIILCFDFYSWHDYL